MNYLPKGKNISVVNPYHKYEMSKNALKTFVVSSSSKKHKTARVGTKKGRAIAMSSSLTKRPLGSMNRLARLKALAISGKKNGLKK